MTSSRDERLNRLSDAVDLYLELRDSETKPTAESVLADRPDLRELLDPVLTEEDVESADPASPRYFAGFELLREIGRGGAGVVYEARESDLDRRVALKILGRGPELTASSIERFRREAAAAGKLHHPHIASVFRVGEHEGTHFIAMEYVDGRNLAAVIRDAGDDPLQVPNELLGSDFVQASTELVATVADALSYAHSHGIVHRDVKPHNIVLAREGTPRLVDFGLAKDFGRDAVTRTGDTAGTPDYMSPEQVRGEAIDARTDVFSLGVVLYELLALARPFAAKSPHETLDAILTREPVALRRRNPRVPRDLETICHTAFEKEASRRYASMQEFADDLHRFLRDEPILATPPSALTRGIKFVRRNRAASLAAVFGLLALVIAPIAFAFHFKASRDALAAEQTETRRQRELVGSVLTDARETLDRITQLTQTDLAATPGLTNTQREMLETIVGFHEKVREAGTNDPALRLESAHASSQLGNILGQLGERDRAESHLREAIAQLETLVRETEDITPRRYLATAHRQYSSLLGNSDRTREAGEQLDAAVACMEHTAKTHPDAHWVREELAFALIRRAQLSWQTDGVAGAAGADLQRASELLTSISKPGEHQPILANALSERAKWLAQRGELEQAREALESSRKWLGPLDAPHQRVAVRRRAMDTLTNHGRVLDAIGNLEGARLCLEQALEIARGLARDFPAFESNDTMVATREYDLGIANARMDRLDAALPFLQSAMQSAERALQAEPDSALAASLYANSTSAFVTASMTPENRSVALDKLRSAARRIEEFLDNHPDSRPLRFCLGLIYSNLSLGLSRDDDYEAAVGVSDRAIELLAQLRDDAPEDVETRSDLRNVAARAAWCCLKLGDGERGADYARLMQSTFPEDPLVLAKAARYLLVSSETLDADDERVTGWTDEALGWLESAISIDPKCAPMIRRTESFGPHLKRLGLDD